MKHFVALKRTTLSVLVLATALGGCVSLDEFSCDMHETQTRGFKPVTTYTLVDSKNDRHLYRSLPAGSVAQVPTYKIRFKPGYTKPCTSITMVKDVVIQRSDEPGVVLTEIREFYAEDGTLITTASQEISDQVKKSGPYTASTPLPIPKTAPPGKYKIVSRMQFERRGERRAPIPVARAEGYFYIIPSE